MAVRVYRYMLGGYVGVCLGVGVFRGIIRYIDGCLLERIELGHIGPRSQMAETGTKQEREGS